MENQRRETILVTGFGPFNNHPVNASWEAVKELKKICNNTTEFHKYNIVIKEVPVAYDYVNYVIPDLWKQYNPIFVLHVGVSHKAKCLMIEQHAHSHGYQTPDINNKCPNENKIENIPVETKIDLKQLCDNINKTIHLIDCEACISYDAGRYLCEYTFFQSLCIDPCKTLFVHIPDFNVYCTQQTAQGIYEILCYLISKRDEIETENNL